MARAALLAVAAVLALAAPAGAATPSAFFGMQVDNALIDGRADLSAQLAKMRQTHIGTVRFTIPWGDAQPYASWSQVPDAEKARFVDVDGMPTDFSVPDRLIGAAAAAGLQSVPAVLYAPVWARRTPTETGSSPTAAGRKAYARFLVALVHRYGPAGTFWRGSAYAATGRVRQWQIWNEPNGPFFWTEQPGMPAYAKLLKVAYPAIKRADPKAKVVAAGLFGEAWAALSALYKSGGKRFFDVAAVHPFTLKVSNVKVILQRCRRVMADNRDAKKALMITELSWPASQGKTSIITGFETTPEGQAQRIRQVYPLLVGLRRKYRIPAVFWSTWVTDYTSTVGPFDYTGLFRSDGDRLVAQPSFGAFSATVGRLSSR